MQVLQNASDSGECAAGVLDAVFDVMLMVRERIARHQGEGDGTTLIRVHAMGVLRKRPGATLSTLAAQLGLTLSATSRLVDSLVTKGHVARKIPPGNRRSVSLYLTAAGARIHSRVRGEARGELALALRQLSPAHRAALTRSMQSLRKALEAATDGHHPA